MVQTGSGRFHVDFCLRLTPYATCLLVAETGSSVRQTSLCGGARRKGLAVPPYQAVRQDRKVMVLLGFDSQCDRIRNVFS
jgi:hypothetical protein